VTRIGWIMATCLAVLCVSAPALFHPVPKLIWNASASVPIGLYRVHPPGALRIGELVLVRPPEALAVFLGRRGYLAMGVPLLKHVLALPGQTVCRTGLTITVDGMTMGRALDRDRAGRILPSWWGCRTVADDEVFFMNWQSENSFDGRYFGPLPATTIVGRAAPLWIKEDD
jgi:conjugative transfer signal peptidase TraF